MVGYLDRKHSGIPRTRLRKYTHVDGYKERRPIALLSSATLLRDIMSITSDLREASQKIEDICNKKGSQSQFYRYGGNGYKSSVSHYFQSSCEVAYSAVEPGNVPDLIEIVNVLKKYKIPFAIKGGGHTSNAKFSSTRGIQISMTRFNDITYDNESKTLSIGAGCLFDEVYRDKELNKARRNIVGGEDIGGIGVAGWLLGGGYSMKTNRFGLGIDNVEAYKVVVPGKVGESARLEVVKQNDQEQDKQDLFWALRGGGNNFGIATEFTLRTHPQGPVYGGILIYDTKEVEDVKKAILAFLEKSDRRGTIKAYFRRDNTPNGIQFQLLLHCFYDVDDRVPDPDPFKVFLAIRHTGELNVSPGLSTSSNSKESEYDAFDEIAKTRPFGNDDIQPMVGIGENARGRWGCVMLGKYTTAILDTIDKQAEEAAKKMPGNNGKMFTICCKPFIEGMFDNISTDSAQNGAWPHKKGEVNHPLVVFAEWEGLKNDDFWIGEMKRVLDKLSADIHNTNILPVYSNTALAEHTKVKDIYLDNLERLETIRNRVDPAKLMSLAGGFKIPG